MVRKNNKNDDIFTSFFVSRLNYT